MQQDKIDAALTAALRHLEDSIKSQANNDEKTMSDHLWWATSEAEYAVFLLAIMQKDRLESASLKHGSLPKYATELLSTLVSAQQLLGSAKQNMHVGNYTQSYEDAWTARNLLFEAQEAIERKQRGTGKR